MKDLSKTRDVKIWWGKYINERPVWRTEELPDRSYKKILLDELQFAIEVRRDILVLQTPQKEIGDLIRAHYWEIVSSVLHSYQPYAISGLSAMKYHLEDRSAPKELQVTSQASNIRIDIPGDFQFLVERSTEFFSVPNLDKWCQELKTAKGYKLSIETPESCLLRIRPRLIKDYPDTFSSFLKGVNFNLENLKEMLGQQSKPVVFTRLASYFEQFGKNKEAELIRRIVKSKTDYNAPGSSAVAKYKIPSALQGARTLSDPPYVTRFREQLRYYAEILDGEKFTQKKSKLPLKKILEHAVETKKYDTYHSSTIEGYRVSEDEIQALIEGKATMGEGASAEEIETRMALKGYLEAHSFALKKIEAGFGQNPPLTQVLIKEIFAHLFLPTVDAGLLDRETLTRYRNHPVYIRRSRFVPPNYEKVPVLMETLVEEVNKVPSAITKALLAHYGFVTIHPYKDGNGRVGRFLMNYVLCVSGLQWVTIRVEDREKYFRALETGQVDDSIDAFVKFIRKYFVE